jgi:hypothetical protein
VQVPLSVMQTGHFWSEVNVSNPYAALGPEAFWRSAVGARNALEIDQLWCPKLTLQTSDKVVTAGSCFAQHIGRALTRAGYNWFDAEPGPGTVELNRRFSYGIFSFRTGNIYTTALLRQWLEWALGIVPVADEVWQKDGRFYDPYRPNIEPDGFASAEEMRASREVTLAAIRRAVTEAKVFVFTMGLTEGWVHAERGTVYPMCPGTLAGEFEETVHKFRNYRYAEIHDDAQRVISYLRELNPSLQVLLTVSPVPLTATASGNHVLVATTYSKSVLRAVAGDLRDTLPQVDYFPSYEIITAPAFRGMFFMPNAREVSPKGVEFVMNHFFAGLGAAPVSQQRADQTAPLQPPRGTAAGASVDDVTCEEALLEAFETA